MLGTFGDWAGNSEKENHLISVIKKNKPTFLTIVEIKKFKYSKNELEFAKTYPENGIFINLYYGKGLYLI